MKLDIYLKRGAKANDALNAFEQKIDNHSLDLHEGRRKDPIPHDKEELYKDVSREGHMLTRALMKLEEVAFELTLNDQPVSTFEVPADAVRVLEAAEVVVSKIN